MKIITKTLLLTIIIIFFPLKSFGHVEHYEDECSFFQGEMWGLPDDSVMCNSCVEKENV